MSPYPVISSFFKDYLEPQVRINKMVNKLIPILFLQDLPQEYILSYFYRPLRALSFFKNFVEMSLKAAYSTIAGEKIQIYCVLITGK